jgi:hypothetical protein
MARPGYGFGRPIRPELTRDLSPRPWMDPEWWSAVEIEIGPRPEVAAERS